MIFNKVAAYIIGKYNSANGKQYPPPAGLFIICKYKQYHEKIKRRPHGSVTQPGHQEIEKIVVPFIIDEP